MGTGLVRQGMGPSGHNPFLPLKFNGGRSRTGEVRSAEVGRRRGADRQVKARALTGIRNIMKKPTAINNVSNDAKEEISFSEPYQVTVTISGSAPFIFHRWSNEAVEEKAKAAKGSKAKKKDNVESYVYRDEEGYLCIPGEYLRQAIIHAAKFKQDPRSPRKSAMDLYKAGVVVLTDLCKLGPKDWDYIDRRRVVVQRSAITRERPAMRIGWSIGCNLQILTPEYIDKTSLHEVLTNAGRLVGIGDFRPTFGRFQVDKFEVIKLTEAAE